MPIFRFKIEVLKDNIKDSKWRIKLKNWSSHSISRRLWWRTIIWILNDYQVQQLYKGCKVIWEQNRKNERITKDQSAEWSMINELSWDLTYFIPFIEWSSNLWA